MNALFIVAVVSVVAVFRCGRTRNHCVSFFDWCPAFASSMSSCLPEKKWPLESAPNGDEFLISRENTIKLHCTTFVGFEWAEKAEENVPGRRKSVTVSLRLSTMHYAI
ncbi:unnamed protein product [Clavelina lepadiformis]|uniref:Secreted protein n=1 Tax=Clavelina lepadiformis TaxID=159417 RepID=A0ABP0F4U8_CLALP